MAGEVEGAPSASIDSSLSSEGLKELPTLNKSHLYLYFLFRGANSNNGVRYSFHLFQPQKIVFVACEQIPICLVQSSFSSPIPAFKITSEIVTSKDFVNLIQLFLFIFRTDVSMFCLAWKTIRKDSGRGPG